MTTFTWPTTKLKKLPKQTVRERREQHTAHSDTLCLKSSLEKMHKPILETRNGYPAYFKMFPDRFVYFSILLNTLWLFEWFLLLIITCWVETLSLSLSVVHIPLQS